MLIKRSDPSGNTPDGSSLYDCRNAYYKGASIQWRGVPSEYLNTILTMELDLSCIITCTSQ